MVPMEAIDLTKCPDPIKDLYGDRGGFSTVGIVDQILECGLRFRIVDGQYHPKRDYYTDKFSDPWDQSWDKCDSSFYGFTDVGVDDPDTFTVHISAQLIWPLLVPEYSHSEKLCCSFMVAVTILHELMHATHYATAFMCGALGERTLPDQSARIVDLLDQAGRDIFDMSHANGEPYWKDDFWAEVGSAFEYETFDMSVAALPIAESMTSLQPLMLEGYSWPAVFCEDEGFLNVAKPVVDFSRPIRIDWVAKCFNQTFWDEDIAAFGLEWIKLSAPDEDDFTLMSCDWYHRKVTELLVSKMNLDFFETVYTMLERRGHTILANYCKSCLVEMRGVLSIKSRYHQEYLQRVEHNQSEVMIDPLPTALDKMYNAARLGVLVLNHWGNPDRRASHASWLVTFPSSARLVSDDEWHAGLQELLIVTFCNVGTLLKHVKDLHNIHLRQFGRLQHYIYEYFQQNKQGRYDLWPHDQENVQFGWVEMTLGTYRKAARDIANLLWRISQNERFRGQDDTSWMLEWNNHFANLATTLDALHEDLIGDHVIKKDDNEVEDILGRLKVPSSAAKSRTQQLQRFFELERDLASPGIRDTIDKFMDDYARLGALAQGRTLPFLESSLSPRPSEWSRQCVQSLDNRDSIANEHHADKDKHDTTSSAGDK
ncbi:hypothetical protein TruAng_009093 [Truncatella angustata]|nr:hypothetical protein TruAng_009093 [Truncatella angustata]